MMKILKLFISSLSYLVLILGLSKIAYAAPISPKDWKQYIPVMGETIQADVMELNSHEELQKLTTKFQEGVQKKPEWALKFMGSAPKGHPLPYHENFGLTKQEFEKMLELTQKKGALSLKKTGTITLKFQALKDGRVKIVTKENSVFNNLIISSEKIETNISELTTVTPIHNQDTKSITGPWKGIKWGKNTFNEKTMRGQIIQFCIGKLDTKNQGIIYYDGKILNGSTTPPKQFTYVLFFPLPQKG